MTVHNQRLSPLPGGEITVVHQPPCHQRDVRTVFEALNEAGERGEYGVIIIPHSSGPFQRAFG